MSRYLQSSRYLQYSETLVVDSDDESDFVHKAPWDTQRTDTQVATQEATPEATQEATRKRQAPPPPVAAAAQKEQIKDGGVPEPVQDGDQVRVLQSRLFDSVQFDERGFRRSKKKSNNTPPPPNVDKTRPSQSTKSPSSQPQPVIGRKTKADYEEDAAIIRLLSTANSRRITAAQVDDADAVHHSTANNVGDVDSTSGDEREPAESWMQIFEAAKQACLRSARSVRASTKSQRDCTQARFIPVDWPEKITCLGAQYNPRGIRFQDVGPDLSTHMHRAGIHVLTLRYCNCTRPCVVSTCTNAESSYFCDARCCQFEGLCGNGLEGPRALALVRDTEKKQYALIASGPIDKDVVIGQYLGEMKKTKVGKDGKTVRNNGYRFMMHHDQDHASNKRVINDASRKGSILRFMNHSCSPLARFRQVANGTKHTVVAVTTRRVKAGEEITVDYGRDLWFVCRCGSDNCVHRDVQTQEVSLSA